MRWLAQACGKIRNAHDRVRLEAQFSGKGRVLWDEAWLRERLSRVAASGYENQVLAVVAKLLLRE